MSILTECTHVASGAMWRSEAGAGYPHTGVTDDYELPGRCLELNPGPLREQQVLYITEPSQSIFKSPHLSKYQSVYFK